MRLMSMVLALAAFLFGATPARAQFVRPAPAPTAAFQYNGANLRVPVPGQAGGASWLFQGGMVAAPLAPAVIAPAPARDALRAPGAPIPIGSPFVTAPVPVQVGGAVRAVPGTLPWEVSIARLTGTGDPLPPITRDTTVRASALRAARASISGTDDALYTTGGARPCAGGGACPNVTVQRFRSHDDRPGQEPRITSGTIATCAAGAACSGSHHRTEIQISSEHQVRVRAEATWAPARAGQPAQGIVNAYSAGPVSPQRARLVNQMADHLSNQGPLPGGVPQGLRDSIRAAIANDADPIITTTTR